MEKYLKIAIYVAIGILIIFLLLAALGWKENQRRKWTKNNNQKKFNEVAKVRKLYSGKKRYSKAPKI